MDIMTYLPLQTTPARDVAGFALSKPMACIGEWKKKETYGAAASMRGARLVVQEERRLGVKNMGRG
jgi:hypothetical protein